MNLLDRIAARPARTAEVRFPLDPNAATDLVAARLRLSAATGDERAAAQAEVERLEAAQVLVTIHMAGIGTNRLEALMDEHKRPDGSVDTAKFTPALLAQVTRSIVASDCPDQGIESLNPVEAATVLARLSIEDQGRLTVVAMGLDREATVIGFP